MAMNEVTIKLNIKRLREAWHRAQYDGDHARAAILLRERQKFERRLRRPKLRRAAA